MKRPNLIFCILLPLLFSISSCKDFIEPSIGKRQVTLQAPKDDLQSKSYKISFWWDEVEDAMGYRLQVASPSFDQPERLVMDTLVRNHQFSANFDPGIYQWRLRAENGSSVTSYSAARNFEVLQSSIKEQSVELTTPADNLLTNNPQLYLKWGALYGATRYRVQIDINSFADENALLYDHTVGINELTFTVPKDQLYQWRVRAENDTAQSHWSAVSHFTVDHTAPARVKATAPADNQFVTKPVRLSWENTPSAVSYQLSILRSDSTTTYNSTFPVMVIGTSYDFQSGAPGEKIYWKVAAKDAAGNLGQASAARSFTIQ